MIDDIGLFINDFRQIVLSFVFGSNVKEAILLNANAHSPHKSSRDAGICKDSNWVLAIAYEPTSSNVFGKTIPVKGLFLNEPIRIQLTFQRLTLMSWLSANAELPT